MKTTAMKKTAANKFTSRLAFTLVELLVVISIIGVLAAFTVPVLKSLKRREFISKTQAELALLETAIDSYKAAYGFYPPDNTNIVNNLTSAMTNQLYYELIGTTNNGVNYVALDGSAQIPVGSVGNAFGVGGFMNCNSANKVSSEDSPSAKSFLSSLKPNQYATIADGAANVTLLVASVGGPDQKYQPLNTLDLNPWRYVAQGTNNPGGYDLWVQLVIAGQTNLVCNWNKQIQINSPLP
jgi:prepilin-type N-terminal cleavage/methylation domain-containing protein